MADKTQIVEALRQLDPQNDSHWTGDKKPAMATIESLLGDKSATRADVEAAAEGFNRDTASGYFMTVAAAAPASEPAKPWEGAAPAAPATEDTPADTPAPVADETPAEEPAASPREEGVTEENDASEGGEGGPADDGETEQPEMEDGAAGSDEIEALAEELHSREEAIAELRVEANALRNKIDEEEAEADKIRMRIEQLKPKNSNQATIQTYLEMQKNILEERGERQKALREAGVDLKTLTKSVSKSPIDQAMARKTGRGGKRPTRT